MVKEVKRSPQVEAEFKFKAGDSKTLRDLANSLDQDFKQSAKIIRKDLDRLVTHFMQAESVLPIPSLGLTLLLILAATLLFLR